MGRDLRLRLRARAYLGLTGLFYLFVGLAYSNDFFRLATSFDPGIGWSCAFLLAGILALFGWTDRQYNLGRKSLYLASAIAGGFSVLFLSHVVTGEPAFALGAVVWGYIASAHFSVARLPDPYILALFESELAKLEHRLGAKSNE